MTNIILPIKPKYVKEIFNGNKIFELRKRIPTKEISKIFVYETRPISKVVGILKIKGIVKQEIIDLWIDTKYGNAISKKDFFDYFKNEKYGYYFEIENYKKFKTNLDLSYFGLDPKFPPQSFIYTNKDIMVKYSIANEIENILKELGIEYLNAYHKTYRWKNWGSIEIFSGNNWSIRFCRLENKNLFRIWIYEPYKVDDFKILLGKTNFSKINLLIKIFKKRKNKWENL